MYNFFKTMESVADVSDKEYTSIMELTKDIAENAGYYRGVKILKNGKSVERTMYSNKFDDVLVAKWYMHFKSMFTSALSKHYELKEYWSFILQRTFSVVFNSLDLNKITYDNSVNKVVRMSLSNRLGEALYIIGSEKRLNDYNTNKLNKSDKFKNKIRLCSAINHMSLSLEDMHVKYGIQLSDDHNNDDNLIIYELHDKLKNNKYGNKLLNALLYSDKKVNLSKIDDYIDIDKDELTQESLDDIKEAFNIIKDTLKVFVDDKSDEYNFNKKFKIGFEVKTRTV